jgi:hypothetical protein
MPPESQPSRSLIDYEHESHPDTIRLAWSGSNVELHLGKVRHDLHTSANVEHVSARIVLHPPLAQALHQQLGQLLGQLFPAPVQVPAAQVPADPGQAPGPTGDPAPAAS